MKGFNDLKKLAFGTVIYDTGVFFKGAKGIVGILEDHTEIPTITVIWEHNGAITFDMGDTEFTFSLEKPKKTVKREKVMYTDYRGIQFLSQERGIEVTLSDEIDTELYYVPVTITFETEE